MTDRRDKPTVGFWGSVAVAGLLLYALSAVPMFFWHESGTMPNAVQDAAQWTYTPLHWLVVQVTGCCNG